MVPEQLELFPEPESTPAGKAEVTHAILEPGVRLIADNPRRVRHGALREPQGFERAGGTYHGLRKPLDGRGPPRR